MGRPTYRRLEDDSWVSPRRRGFRLACCDCGLIHVLNFRLVPTLNGGRKIQFQAFRDNRATAAHRRGRSMRATLRRVLEVVCGTLPSGS